MATTVRESYKFLFYDVDRNKFCGFEGEWLKICIANFNFQLKSFLTAK